MTAVRRSGRFEHELLTLNPCDIAYCWHVCRGSRNPLNPVVKHPFECHDTAARNVTEVSEADPILASAQPKTMRRAQSRHKPSTLTLTSCRSTDL